MKLVSAYDVPQASAVLYQLLAERPREAWISHRRMPSVEEHEAFVRSRPYRYWLLIENNRQYIGAIEVLETNEIGISLLGEYHHMGLGQQALRIFMSGHKPLPAIPAKRNGHWLANVAPGNNESRLFFERNGFRVIQHTLEKT